MILRFIIILAGDEIALVSAVFRGVPLSRLKKHLVILDAYHLAKEIPKFRLKVKWHSNFPGNLFSKLYTTSFTVPDGTTEISLSFTTFSSFQFLSS